MPCLLQDGQQYLARFGGNAGSEVWPLSLVVQVRVVAPERLFDAHAVLLSNSHCRC